MLSTLGKSTKAFGHLPITRDGKQLALSAGADMQVWDLQTDQCVCTLEGGGGKGLWHSGLSRDGRFLAVGYGSDQEKGLNKVLVWEVRTGRKRHELVGQAVISVAFHPDGSRLATGGQDHTVKIWDLATGHEILTLRGHSGWVRAVEFTPDGRRLVSAADDKKVLVLDGRPLRQGEKIGQELFTLAGHGNNVKGAAFHPKEPRLATGGADGLVKLWDTRTGKALRTVFQGPGIVETVAFSPDGKRLAVAGQPPKFATILDAKKGDVLVPMKGERDGNWMMKVAFSPDGKTLAVAANDKTVVLHDAATGAEIGRLPGHLRPIHAVAFHPDPGNHFLASTASLGERVLVWTTKPLPGRLVPSLRHGGITYGASFSREGRLLATGGAERRVRVWDTTTWKPVDRCRDLTGGVECLAFSPADDRLIAWGGTDSTVKVWQRDSGEVVTLRGHSDVIQGIAFSPDGNLIASGSNDGTVRIWETPNLP